MVISGGCGGCGGVVISGGGGCCGGMMSAGGGGGAGGGGAGGAGGGSAGGGGRGGASGGGGGQSGIGGASSGVSQDLEALKKSLQELKTEQNKIRVEALKQVAEELRLKATDQKIDELRRAVEELKHRPAAAPIPLPPPLPGPLPTPRPRPDQAPPQPGKVQLDIPAGAIVFVNDKPLGTARTFVTPPLEAGRDHFYQFEVTVVRDGRNITRVQRVPIQAGATVRLAYEQMESGDRWSRAEAAGAPAYITVRLPADARLTIDDAVCPLTSDTRAFATPSLAPGREYYYLLKAEVVRDGRTATQTQRVTFRRGERVTVSFDNLGASRLTAR